MTIQEYLQIWQRDGYELDDRETMLVCQSFAAGAQSREGEIEKLNAERDQWKETNGYGEYEVYAAKIIALERERAELERQLADATARAEMKKAEDARYYLSNGFIPVEHLRAVEAKLADVLLKDRGKTTEINLLVAENRTLAAALKERGVDVAQLMPRCFKAEADRIEADKKVIEAALIIAHRNEFAVENYCHGEDCNADREDTFDGCDCGLADIAILVSAIRARQEAIERGGRQ